MFTERFAQSVAHCCRRRGSLFGGHARALALLLWLAAVRPVAAGEPPADPAAGGPGRELWIAARTDGKPGLGTPGDPLDGGTQAKFDALLHGLWKANARNVTLHLGPGTFETFGSNGCMAGDPAPGWRVDEGWKIIGAGMGNTLVRLAGFSYGGNNDPSAANCVIATNPWNKQDIEVRDLTIDCNWTKFGSTLSAPFTVPADRQTVTVEVEITVVGIGQPKPDWPQASEIVIRDCVVDDIRGQYGWIIQVHGNNTDWPSKNYGTQAIVEGNTIYGNGLHQGLGGWNYVNSLWINNKVVNCSASFFTDTPHCWNNLVKNNLFLECKSYTVILGGGCPAWKPQTPFKPGDATLAADVFYLCKAGHVNRAPPDAACWTEMPHQAHTGWNSYVFEDNLFEICDRSGPLLFNGNVARAIFRNNILRYADGQGRGSHGLELSNPTNRGLIVTGNVIDSRLKNGVGRSIVFGKDNVDEQGRLRRELEFGRHGR